MKHIFRIIFRIIFLLISAHSYGQLYRVEEIKQVNPFDSALYIFPKIVMPYKKKIERKINKVLQMDMLQTEKATPENHIFDSIWATSESFWSLNYIEYKVKPNTNAVFSISISGESCYAYCEENSIDFTFNLKTGDRLTLENIFNEAGLKILLDSLNLSKMNQLEVKLKEVKDTLNEEGFVDEEGYFNEMLEMYTECLNNKIQLEYINGFLLSEGKLTITTDRCSSHVNRYADELWQFQYNLNLRNWTTYLTKYGLSISQK